MGYIADILKYEGDNTTFVWKHPCEDFNSYTQLIVHETQEAVLFLNGQALWSRPSHTGNAEYAAAEQPSEPRNKWQNAVSLRSLLYQ